MKRFWGDIAGTGLIILALLTLLALLGLTSSAWVSPWAAFLRRWLGWGSIYFVLSCATAGLLLINKQRDLFTSKDWRRVIWLEVFAFSTIALLTIIGGNSIERAEAGLDGGLVGWGISVMLAKMLGALPVTLANSLRAIILTFFAVLGFLLGFGLFTKVIRKVEKILEGGSVLDLDFLRLTARSRGGWTPGSRIDP